jgi:hypothetical protein
MTVRASDISMRTTAGESDAGTAQVVAGYGWDPAAAISSLRHAAAAAARDMAGAAFEVIGVQFAAGEVPDVGRVANDLTRPRGPAAKYATRPRWCAFGTLVAVPAAQRAITQRAAG